MLGSRAGYEQPRAGRCMLLVLLVVCLALSTLCLSGCLGLQKRSTTAAVVNGEPILESDVTAYIEGFRATDENLGKTDGWSDYLSSTGYTPSSLRRYILNSVFIPRILIEQECKERGITVTENEVDSAIASQQSAYENLEGADSWNSALVANGYDETSWRDHERRRLLEEKLAKTVVEKTDVSNSQVQNACNEHASEYNGKHSYYIAFVSEEAAREASGELATLANDTVTLEDFSEIGGTVKDAGWTSLPADNNKMSQAYLQTLDTLGVGTVSDPVAIDDKFYLIFCDELFKVDENVEFVQMADIPDEILEQLRHVAVDEYEQAQFEDWLDSVRAESEVEYTAMPQGLPYDLEPEKLALENEMES